MDVNMLGRLYKGEEYTMTLPVPFSGEVDDFQFLLFTDSATTVEIPKSQITIEDGVMEFTVQETDLDVLNDGVLNYYLKYTVGSTDKIQCTNTMHYLKSPSDYNPKTTQDIYNEGYEAGVEAGSGDYSEGFVDGEQAQKDKLTGITINQNGTYQREDGYNNVIVSVPQTGITRPEYVLAGMCMYYVITPVAPSQTISFTIPNTVVAMYLNDDTPIDISEGSYTFTNSGNLNYNLKLTIYTVGPIDNDIILHLSGSRINSMEIYGNVMWGQCPNTLGAEPRWIGNTLNITTGMCKSNHLILSPRCGYSGVTTININVPLAWVGDYTSLQFPDCNAIYLNENTDYVPEYRASSSIIKYGLPQNGTLYCKQGLRESILATNFWSHFPSGWSVSDTL